MVREKERIIKLYAADSGTGCHYKGRLTTAVGNLLVLKSQKSESWVEAFASKKFWSQYCDLDPRKVHIPRVSKDPPLYSTCFTGHHPGSLTTRRNHWAPFDSSRQVVWLCIRVASIRTLIFFIPGTHSTVALRGLLRSDWGRPLGGTSAWRPATVTGPAAVVN